MSRIVKSFTVYSSQLTVNREQFLKPAPESEKGNFSGRTNWEKNLKFMVGCQSTSLKN